VGDGQHVTAGFERCSFSYADQMTDQLSVLVTGGAGYIGSHCCKALNEAGFSPVCFDNFSTGHPQFVKWGPLIKGDVRDTEAVIQAFRQYPIAAVMHFAASSAVGESVVDPEKYYTNNVEGSLSLLRAMREANCAKLVFSSTGAVYGKASLEPIGEAAARKPVNPYGSSKLMIEQIISDYRAAYQLQSICFRYFNASGADSSGVIGELRDPETHLIPRAMMRLQGHVSDFAVFGEDYDTPDGTAVRDYIHVADLAAAHVLAVQLLAGDHQGGTYNLGTGRGYSVKEVLSAIAKEAAREVPFVLKERRAGDPPILVADPTAAERELGFRPRCSQLATIVRSAWIWHQKAHPVRAAELLDLSR
jgi:UDP-glucose-4-epimerase GalE